MATVLSPIYLLWLVIGTVVGIIFGAIPGLTAVMAIALFLPMTYGMSMGLGISVLIALYIGAISGGLISAILLKIPGTPSSVATCWDGHPLAEKGEAAKALGVGIVFSFLGTIVSIVALVFIAPTLAKLALRFGPQEYFSIAVFSLTLIATLSSGSMIKGLFSGVIGFVFATVGIAPVDADVRFTFGHFELNNGFDTLTVLIGLFAITEIIKVAESSKYETDATIMRVDMKKVKGFGFSLKEFFQQMPNFFRSSAIGVGIGILPGIGGATSNILSYLVAKKQSKHPEKFGTGIIDGVVASETANNATIGGALIPLLTLGIPGDGVTAVMLGGFLVHGIQPGPMLFRTQASLIYIIFAALIVSSILMLVIEFYGLRLWVKLLKVPKHILLPIIFVLCVVGAFGLSSRLFDVWTILVFGVIGYGFVKFGIPQAPFIIGFILGPMAETNLRRGLMLTDGNFMGFITDPLSGAFLLIAVIAILWPIVKPLLFKNAKKRQRDAVM
jgi:putative tricarboxylic transport membrane protein